MPIHNQHPTRILTSPCHEAIPENRKAHGDCLYRNLPPINVPFLSYTGLTRSMRLSLLFLVPLTVILLAHDRMDVRYLD